MQHLGNDSFRGSGDHLAVWNTLSVTTDPEAMDTRCRTLLAIASATRNVEAAKALLEAGAHPRVTDVDKNTPSHYFGFAYASEAVIVLLFERGAGLDTLNSDTINGDKARPSRGFCTQGET